MTIIGDLSGTITLDSTDYTLGGTGTPGLSGLCTCAVTPGGFFVYMAQSEVVKLLGHITNGKNSKAVDLLNKYAVLNDTHAS